MGSLDHLSGFPLRQEMFEPNNKTIQKDKPVLTLASVSGGKDSTAMLLRLLEEGRQVDEILFCDTGLEFPQMYAHLEKLERYIGRPITRLKAPYTFEQYFYEYQAKGDAALVTNRGLSWPSRACRWCTGRLKAHVIAKHLQGLKRQYRLVQYVGIAADEANRCKDLHYPLVEWGMTEADCLNYCYARGFDWGGLYKIFRRVSCWCCPLQPISELRKLRAHCPELWQKLLYMDAHTWQPFRPDYTAQQLEQRFALEEERAAQGLPNKGRAFMLPCTNDGRNVHDAKRVLGHHRLRPAARHPEQRTGHAGCTVRGAGETTSLETVRLAGLAIRLHESGTYTQIVCCRRPD